MSDSEAKPRVLFTGAAGQLGRYLARSLGDAGYEAIGTVNARASKTDLPMNIADSESVNRGVAGVRPDVIIHGAAYTDVDGCERDPERADLVNHQGAALIAAAARENGAWLIAIGTDFVFSGANAPYAEDAGADPVSVYGASKLAGEQAVLAADPSFAVARTSWVFGGAGKHFPRTVLTMVRDRGGMQVVNDESSCPTFASDLATALVSLISHRPSGILHLTNEGGVDRFTFAQEVVRAAGGDPATITSTTTTEFLARYPLPAKRPANSTMQNTRARALGVVLPDWHTAVRNYVPVLATELGFPVAPAN